MEKVQQYLEEVKKKFKTGHAREHAYRPALEGLIEDINSKINAVNDPKQQKVGAPDFVLFKGKIPVGYIEAKDVDIDLDKEIKSKNQVNRYKASLNNLCFTNYLEFRFYVDGEETERVTIGEIEGKEIKLYPEKFELLESLLKNFTIQKTVSIKNPKELAYIMAQKAKMLKNIVYMSLHKENTTDGVVEKQYEASKKMLIHDLSFEQFADIYSQTVAYGMFAARYRDPTIENFTRDEANALLPKSNPFLRNFFQSIAGYNIDERIVWIVDDLAEVFNHVNVRELLENYGKETKRSDVIVHFYETFLAEYDAKMRKSRGVYYTPEPVVDFIVRAVDDILKEDFDIKDGLADTEKIEVLKEDPGKKKRTKVKEHRVQILDPATGTGTFLDHTIKHIYNSKFKGQEGLWQSYVDDDLLPRLHGFEILMASYAMAHLKLDITLAETGYDVSKGKGKRLGVYLTNSLEEPESLQRDLFSQWLSTESLEANEVKKEKPIMVVMGNPPYSVSSTNKGEWIENLMEDYKKDLNERNIQPLSDDYIKFIRYAQWFVEKNGEGIVAYISNNSFIDGIIHRQMRKSLLETFDKIYILDLHGNSKKREKSPDGGKDENVFDIQQGVSINIFIKKNEGSSKLGSILHSDLFGERGEKYKYLINNSIKNIRWKELEYRVPDYYFVNKNYRLFEEYEESPNMSTFFSRKISGIQTGRDSLFIDYNKVKLSDRIKTLLNGSLEDDFKRDFNIKDSSSYNLLKRINEAEFNSNSIIKVLYKPFDKRYIYYDRKLLKRSFYSLFKNVLPPKYNLALCLMRSQVSANNLNTVYISSSVNDINLFGFQTYSFPLYIYTDSDLKDVSRQPNLDQKLVSQIADKLNLSFIPDHEHADACKKGTFNPLDILDYIYAILHSPTYRERYKEFLKIDFPRVPFTSDKKLFWKLVEKGRELREFHLMEHKESDNLITTFPVTGDNEVTRRITKTSPGFELTDKKRKLGKVWINDNQYFDNVPELAWNFYIGGYQPAQKWLKYRRDMKLDNESARHYQKIIVALVNTDRIMKEIDDLIDEWPIK